VANSSPIAHVELATTNPEQSTEFYSTVFGWKMDSSFPGYPMFQPDAGPGGGFVQVGESQGPPYKPGDILVYLGVDDIDSKLREIESNGGKTVFPKTEIPGMGWYALFTDPSGNRLGLFQGGGGPQAG
jgi:hypothetical protein